MNPFASLLTALTFFGIALVTNRLGKWAEERGDIEAARKWAQHEFITALMPVGVSLTYWIFG